MKRLVPLLLLGCAAPPRPPDDVPRPPLLLDVSEVEAEALSAADGHADFAFCEYVATVTGFDAARVQLELFPENHRGCGRCARHFYRVFAASRIDKWDPLRDYVLFLSAAFPGHDMVFLTAFRLENELSRLGWRGSEACRYWELSLGRFESEGALRKAWAAAQSVEEEHQAFLWTEGHPLAETLGLVREDLDTDPQSAVRRIRAVARGTPFEEAVRFLAACELALDGRFEEALQVVGAHRSAVLHYCGCFSDDEEYFRLQLREAPHWEWDVSTHLALACLESKRGRDAEALPHLWFVLDQPPLPSERVRGDRSAAGKLLGEYYEKTGDWHRALRAWFDWDVYMQCGTGQMRELQRRAQRILWCILRLATVSPK